VKSGYKKLFGERFIRHAKPKMIKKKLQIAFFY